MTYFRDGYSVLLKDKDFQTEDGSTNPDLDSIMGLLSQESKGNSGGYWSQYHHKHRPMKSQQLIEIAILVLLVYIAFISSLGVLTTFNEREVPFSSTKASNGGPTYPELPYCKRDISPKTPKILIFATTAPINSAVHYEYQKLGNDSHSKWYGPPSDEIDAAWDGLLEAMNIHATKAEFELQGENFTDMVQLANGDYLGIIGVWHQIHCLDIMRRAFHLDYYAPRLVDGESEVYNIDHYGESQFW